MCGITFLLSEKNKAPQTATELTGAQPVPNECLPQSLLNFTSELESKLHQRGPDYSYNRSLSLSEELQLHFWYSVLHIRGPLLSDQVFSDESGNVLLWNGEIFENSFQLNLDQNDTTFLLKMLANATQSELINILHNQMDGPFAFVFWKNSEKKVYFGKSRVGHRSLLVHFPTAESPHFALSSVSFGPKSQISKEYLNHNNQNNHTNNNQNNNNQNNQNNNNQNNHNNNNQNNQNKTNEKRSNNQDSEEEEKESTVKSNWEELRPGIWTLSLGDPSFSLKSISNWMQGPSPSSDLTFSCLSRGAKKDDFDYLEAFESILLQSVKTRVSKLPELSADLENENSQKTQKSAKLGILFSGGIDSTMLAAAADKVLPIEEPIDLLNVAFGTNFDTPDRKTGRSSWAELRGISPNRKWNFIQIDVPSKEVLEHQQRILDLIFPQNTLMDMTLATSLWFASRGIGALVDPNDHSKTSPHRFSGKVLLDGLGADETLGGYGRHRVLFSKFGESRLNRELDLDINRLWVRNLGRDDRVISDNSREARFPFLSKALLEFLTQVPLSVICDFSLAAGQGDKKLLRTLAEKWKLTEVSRLAKRAMQFGTRVNHAFFPKGSAKLDGTAIFTPVSLESLELKASVPQEKKKNNKKKKE